MVKFLASRGVYRILRCLLGLLFVVSGGGKLTDVGGFTETVSDYGLVFEPLLLPTAVGLSILEIVVGLGLLLEVRGCLGLISGMLLGLTGVLGYGIWLGLDIDCGCFGTIESLFPELGLRGAVVRNLCLLAACAYLYFLRSARSARPRSLGRVVEEFRSGRRGVTNDA